MASPNFITNTYAGTLLEPYLSKTILASRTFGNPALCTVAPNIQGTKVLRKVNAPVTFANNSADFTPVGEVDLAEKILTPVRMSVQIAMDRDRFYQSWESELMQAGINKSGPPEQLRAAVTKIIGERIGAGVEHLAWNGKTANEWSSYTFSGSFPGWVASALSATESRKATTGTRGTIAATGITNAGVVTVGSTANLKTGDFVSIKVANGNQQYSGATIVGQTFGIVVLSGTTLQLLDVVTLTNATLTGSTAATSATLGYINEYSVQEALSIVWRSTPNQVRIPRSTEDRAFIYVSPDVMIAYKNSIAQARSLTAGYIDTRTDVWADEHNDTWNGNRVTVVPNMLPGTIMVAQPSNLYFGLSAMSDMDTIDVVDFRTILGNTIGFRTDFSGCAEIAWPELVSVVSAARAS